MSFYADWVAEMALASEEVRESYAQKPVKNLKQCFKLLKEDYSLMGQNKIRNFLPQHKERLPGEAMGRLLKRAIHPERPDRYLVALFRSHLMQHCFSDIRRLSGYVQHDQYHRFTADTHIMQAMREVRRVYKDPQKELGLLKEFSLSKKDWQILMWTAVFHDIAKGLPGHHAIVGEKKAKQSLKKWGFAKDFTEEVAWLVKNHLKLSEAAFRKNPDSPQTWQELKDSGVLGKRLWRLGVFTFIDIRATNPEAWNTWKERLLFDLIKVMDEEATRNILSLKQMAQRKKVKVEPVFELVDKAVLSEIPVGVLLRESMELEGLSKKESLKPLLLQKRQGELWVRLHSVQNGKGTLVDFVSQLYLSGYNIRHACISSSKDYGAYDWFKVKTSKSLTSLEKILNLKVQGKVELKPVKFDRILITHRDDTEVIISFRGKDQRGLLVSAVQALFSWGLEVRWARVHTWGRQIDDVFSVLPRSDIDLVVEELRKEFVRD